MSAALAEAMTLPGIAVGPWQVRSQTDPRAVALANRHYSREKRGSHQVGGPGYRLVLVTPCERAVWISKRHAAGTTSPRSLHDGLDAWRCQMFRNEGAGLASDLIREAMELTARLWTDLPPDGWATYVDPRKVASANPGYCFKKAGWWVDRTCTHPYLIRLRAAA